MLVWIPIEFRRRPQSHLLGNRVSPIAALGHKLRVSGALPRLYLSPVVIGGPVLRQFPHAREWDALGRIIGRLPLGPIRGRYPPTEVCESDLEWTDGAGVEARGIFVCNCGSGQGGHLCESP